MKTRLMLILGIAAVLFTNCTKSEIDSPFNTATVVANMESDAVKSSATDQGYFTWEDGDKIAIHTSEGNLLVGTLNDGEGSASGSFSYSYTGDAPTLSGYALYPYNDGHSITESAVTFVMPATYKLGEVLANTNSPMIARPVNRSSSGTENYDFAHLGGLFRFVIKNAPAGADKFTLSLGGNKINGEFTVSLNEEIPQIVTTEGSDGNNVTILSFTALESVQDITLFVPVPVGEYTGIDAKLYKGEEVLGEWGSDDASNIVARKSLMLMAPITFSNAGGNIENEISAGSATQLEDALQNDGVVVMTEPITLSKSIEVPNGVSTTLDLQGQTLNNGEFSIVVGEGSTLNIINNAAQTKSASSASIEGSGDIIVASANSIINISAGVSLTSTDNCCIFVPKGAEGATITTAGNLLSEGTYATVQVNGYVESGTINIKGGNIRHTGEGKMPLYIAGNVDVTIEGEPTIEGSTALEQRAGTLTINGGTFIANGQFDVVANDNGSTTTGVAVAICQHNTQKETQATINGGTFTGAKCVYMKPYGENTNVSLVVNGGQFSTSDAEEYVPVGKSLVKEGDYYTVSDGIKSEAALRKAITAGGDVILSSDITLTEEVTVPDGKSTTLDLQGQTLNNGAFSIVVGEGSTLNIVNNSASSATIEGSGDIIKASKDATINISAGVSLTSTANCCIFVPQGADGATITTAGNLLSEGEYATVQVNGYVESGTINITGGNIKHTGEEKMPLYIAGNVDVTISGEPTIEGSTALEQRAGTLTINGGTFKANGQFNVEANDNGSTTTGVAVAICQHNTKMETRATINGGTFTGDKCVYMEPYDNTQSENVSLVVTGGTFENLDEIYLAEGYGLEFEANDDGTYDVIRYYEIDTDGAYVLSSAQGMFWFAREVNINNKTFSGNTIKLKNNIDLNNQPWTPIGQTGYTQFKGTFDGNGKTIYNLTIDTTNEENRGSNHSTGLFGWLNGATVRNLTIDGANISGSHNVAGIAGYLELSGCTVESCHVKNAVISCTLYNEDLNGDKCGAIVAYANNSGVLVNNCTAEDCTITASRDAGQIVGAGKESFVTNCSATNVEVSHNGKGTGANINNNIIGRVLL